MRRLRFYVLFLVSFVFAGGALFSFLNHMGLFELGGVPVDLIASHSDSGRAPSQGSAEKSLLERLDAILADYQGKRIWEIDLTRMRSSIARDEWVKDVLISRTLPNQLRVLVRPKTAALVYVNKQNQFLPVVEDGALLSPVAAAALPDVPLLRGEIFLKEPGRRSEAVKLVQALAERGPMGVANISEIGWSGEDGFTLTLIQPKVEVRLGDERVDLKAMRVAQVLNYLTANNLKGRVIDASFSKKVLVRLRKGP